MIRTIALAALLPLAALAESLVASNGVSVLAIPAPYSRDAPTLSQRATNTAYAIGDKVRIDTGSYVARYGGTTGVATNAPLPVITDGTVTWLRLPKIRNSVILIQKVSGSTAKITIGGSDFYLIADGAMITLTDNSIPPMDIYAEGVGGNSTLSTLAW